MYSKNHNESNTVFSLYFNGEREDKIMGSFKLYSRCEEPLIFCKSLLSSVSFNRNMMKVQYFFYVLGILFLFATLAYFSYEYLFDLTNTAKTSILVLIAVIFFSLGDIMRERDV